MKNGNHDLIHQLSEDLDSLWRYETYLKNAADCKHCLTMWREFKKIDEKKIERLKLEIERHVKEGKFN